MPRGRLSFRQRRISFDDVDRHQGDIAMKKPIPTFESESEEHSFWAAHDSTEYVDWTVAESVSLPNVQPSSKELDRSSSALHSLIRSRATAFRQALQVVAPRSHALALLKFPHGSCGDVTDLLGTYLKDRGLGTFDYVLGEKFNFNEDGDYLSHTWLQHNALIVDITAGQFPEIHESVIVTIDSPWHRSFRRSTRRIADFRTGGSPELDVLVGVYAEVARLADEILVTPD